MVMKRGTYFSVWLEVHFVAGIVLTGTGDLMEQL